MTTAIHPSASPSHRRRLAAPRLAPLLAPLLALTALGGCVAPVGPVEVTRFSLPDGPALGQGVIRIEAGPGQDESSLEFRAYAAAVGQELARIGYRQPLPGEQVANAQVAVVTIERRTLKPASQRGPVSVGVGGNAGNYGSGVGLGIGIDLSGKPADQVDTRMQVMIRDRTGGRTLWEGRASFTVSAKSPMAQTSLGSAKMAEALFKGFPGKSGETILVK
ncbi:DUF4136 domain-containing protein [Novosphingobium clariflavum]|uniref:DUF4136 domain-containing protein n=1 Tax=Novosphingobium clariflavum TaxID=2029884 RepID=A0ABV6SD76_9SPHN|nr:DUF4136 domain-containing protein [Novosphingobium clariflavum]